MCDCEIRYHQPPQDWTNLHHASVRLGVPSDGGMSIRVADHVVDVVVTSVVVVGVAVAVVDDVVVTAVGVPGAPLLLAC